MCTVFEYMYCTMYTQYAYCKFTRTCTVHRHVKARVLCNSVYTVLLSGKKQSYQIFNHQKFRTNSEQISLIFRLKLRTNEPRPKLLVLIKKKCVKTVRDDWVQAKVYVCTFPWPRAPLACATRTGFRFQRLHSERGGGEGGRSSDLI